jgi:hypothetical protein
LHYHVPLLYAQGQFDIDKFQKVLGVPFEGTGSHDPPDHLE